MLTSIDKWLLGRYQALIDITSKKPEWWVEQCALAALIVSVNRFMLSPSHDGWSWMFLFFDITVYTIFYWYSKMPAMLSSLAQSDIVRHFVLVFSSTVVLLDVINIVFARTTKVPLTLIDVFGNVLFCSIYYFAACQPPRPRERKKKLVLAT